ncbi:fructose family permease EIIC subunit 2 [Lactobacillus selangorensis]|uniref:Fructose family permease EIIC subunit 2 n=1 Tax=Lactobacillus selangorensis TaxID=81857 RepID=A0A0R2G0I8_9LACO|nr:fructose-specific PTS transporter subunit EIIC [Lactobacillus selangorensis]KRN27956.1 fructose family permease EIIC subunit 2 [Lactobacillus selangorensis]KRN30573.1 fructose family permease EIIC subunit 2 [Lactobacillus selangorensis]
MNDMKFLFGHLRDHLMTGINYMIPFVASGGILLALSVLLGGQNAVPTTGSLAGLAKIGQAGLGLMVPILSGYTAFAMAGVSGLAAGVIGGLLANNIGAGFIGGIITGILAGVICFYLNKIKLSDSLQGIMPMLVVPLISTLIVGGVVVWGIGAPIAALMNFLTVWLKSLGTSNLLVVGLILGAMVGADCGGPICKVAYGFGAALVGTVNTTTGMPSATAMTIMAGIGVAICIPPLAVGLATLIAPKKFTVNEQSAGKAALVMGAVGISEGAIPFLATDPMRMMPANMIGSAIGASIAMILGAGNPAPWGGWIVAFVAQKPFAYMLASLIGIAISTVLIVVLKPSTVAVMEKSGSEE